MKWINQKIDIKGSAIILWAITAYYILCKSLLDGTIHFLNGDRVWDSSLYVADILCYLAIVAGFYTILRKMDRSPKAKTIEEENHRHQFYRVVVLFVTLVDLIIYRKLNLKISLVDAQTIVFALIGLAMVVIDTLARRSRKKKEILGEGK